MPDKEELLKTLLAGLSEEDLAALVKDASESKKPKGPRKSAIQNSNVVFDNSEFEKIRSTIDKKIPMEERPYQEEDKTRPAPSTRDSIKKIDVTCDRCSKREQAYPGQVSALRDGKAVYLCLACSETIRT